MTSTPEVDTVVGGCVGCAAPGVARRRFLAAGGGVAVAGTLAGCSSGETGGGAATTGADGSTRVPLADVPVGGSLYLDEAEVVVAQPVEGEVVAYDATCPHQGCMVSSTGADDTLVCPCHGSTFAAADGAVVQGPATTGLTVLSARVDGTEIVISG